MPSHSPALPTLVGVGIGPGDPDLVTVGALRWLRAAEVILVPETERRAHRKGHAEEVVAAVVPEQLDAIRKVRFSMDKDLANRQQVRDDAAEAAERAFGEGATCVAMASIGDPAVYSTFTYLADRVTALRPEVQVVTVPGITAMQAIAAATSTPLVTGDEVLALVPATAGKQRLEEVLALADTVVIYKAGRTAPDVVARVKAAGKIPVLAADVGRPAQRVEAGAALDDLAPGGYFTTVLATNPCRRDGVK